MRRLKLLILHFWSALSALRLRRSGVDLGLEPWILGMPDVKRSAGSTIRIGRNVSLFSKVWANPLRPQRPLALHTTQEGALIEIGDGAGISSSVLVSATAIRVGPRSLIGADCLIADTDFHGIPLGSGEPTRSAQITIGADVFIGTRCIVLKGVTIGDRSVIGAGAVVANSIPPDCVAGGNPARVIRQLATPAQDKKDSQERS